MTVKAGVHTPDSWARAIIERALNEKALQAGADELAIDTQMTVSVQNEIQKICVIIADVKICFTIEI